MTVSQQTTHKKRLKTEAGYTRSTPACVEMGCKRKLSNDMHIIVENHSTTTINDNSLEINSEAHFTDMGTQLSCRNENLKLVFRFKKADNLNVHQQPKSSHCLGNAEIPLKEKSSCIPNGSNFNKEKKTGKLENQKPKGQIMNHSRKKQCAVILNKLMTHQYGWVFNQPVDPVKLNIPDYLSIITKPMDLGTVKHNLDSMRYSFTNQFSEDVSLTFANAMQYNPPSNDVHIVAKKLNSIFSSNWKSLEARWIEQDMHILQKKTSKRILNSGQATQKKSTDMENGKAKGAVQRLLRGSETPFSRSPLCLTTSDVINKNHQRSGQEDFEAIGFISKDSQTRSCYVYPSAAAAEGGETPVNEVQLSPSKVLRAAILKSRFADTILKAQQKKFLDHGAKADSRKMQLEKERLEKKQQEEREKIEVQIKAAKAAKAAVRLKEESELRLRREKEREAARLALQKMEKTVDFDENCKFLEEFQTLGYSSHAGAPDDVPMNFVDGVELLGCSVNPLEQLGLFMKNEDLDEDIDEWISTPGDENMEEGEIGAA